MSEIQENGGQQEDREKKLKLKNLRKIEPVSVSVISENQENVQKEDDKIRNVIASEKIECKQIDQVNSLGIR